MRQNFQRALFTVSDCITEGCCAADRGEAARAARLYAAAERYAFTTGYTELVQLVWAYADPAHSTARTSVLFRGSESIHSTDSTFPVPNPSAIRD